VAAPIPAKSSFRFSLRWLFALTTAIAICALVFRIAGRDEAIGNAIALLLLAIAWRFRTRRIVKWPAVVLAVIAVWFSTVDYRWTVEHCRHCPSHWDVTEYRILHCPIWSKQYPDHSPFHAMVCDDLGSPCPHATESWEKWRLWGLYWPRVCHNGTCCMNEDAQWYSAAVRQHVKEIGKREPTLGDEYRQAVRDRRWPTVWKIVMRIQTETDP
jgi:hypothetical protein